MVAERGYKIKFQDKDVADRRKLVCQGVYDYGDSETRVICDFATLDLMFAQTHM